MTEEEKAASPDYKQHGVTSAGNPIWVKTAAAIRRDNGGKPLEKGRQVIRRGNGYR